MPLKARPRWRPLVIGLAVGLLLVGAGGVALAWSMTDQGPSGAAADAEATRSTSRWKTPLMRPPKS